MDKDFPWGEVVEVHTIGPYEIVEYIVGPQWRDAGRTMFFTEYAIWPTLEGAMLNLVCQKYSPGDHHLPDYAAKLIGVPEGE